MEAKGSRRDDHFQEDSDQASDLLPRPLDRGRPGHHRRSTQWVANEEEDSTQFYHEARVSVQDSSQHGVMQEAQLSLHSAS